MKRLSYLITTEVYGDWTTQGTIHHMNSCKYYHVKCTCGTERFVEKSKLTCNISTHCGCRLGEKLSKANLIDLTGKRFGYLVAVSYNQTKGKWLLKCDCGNNHYTRSISLIKGNCKSCGCKSGELLSISRGFKGKRKHWLNNTHSNIMRRCYDSKSPKYNSYGGRGIGVHEMFHDFWVFVSYIEDELGPKPTPQHSLNRIDNDGDYAPGNLEWASPFEQNINKQDTIKFEYKGEMLSIPEICKKFGFGYTFWFSRLKKESMTIKDVLDKIDTYRRRVKNNL